MYNTEYVQKILDEYAQNLQENMRQLELSDRYRELKVLKGKGMREAIQMMHTVITQSIPLELELDYVFIKAAMLSDRGMQVRIIGAEDRISTFNFEKIFPVSTEFSLIAGWIAGVYELIIKNEYALYNLEIVNDLTEGYARRARLRYTIAFQTDMTADHILHSISDKRIVINADIDALISIPDTRLFKERQRVSGAKTRFDIEMVDGLRELKTPAEFLKSRHPLLIYLTQAGNSKPIETLIKEAYPE